MEWIAPLLGMLVLLLLIWDVHATVFVPRGAAGPLARRFYAWSWRSWWRFTGTATTRGKLRLTQVGPLLVPLTVMVWVALLVLGLTLLLFPQADDFRLYGEDTDLHSGWLKALYVSFYSVTTLGVGDITPPGMLGRLLIVGGAAGGFILFTVSLTYLLNVYSALGRATRLAMVITQLTGADAETHPARALRTALVHGDETQLRTWLSSLADTFAGVVLAKEQYPLLSYFYTDRDRSLPVAVTELLELITVIMTLLDDERYDHLINSPFVRRTMHLGCAYLQVLLPGVPERRREEGEPGLDASRELGFELAWLELHDAGIDLRPRDEAWRAYRELRATWDETGHALLWNLGY